MKKWIWIGIAVVVFGVVVFSILRGNRQKARAVEMEEVARKDLVEIVTASGTIHPQRSVDVSANTIGKVTRLAVAEGQRVAAGDFLLEIDPAEFRSIVRALAAAVQTAEADLRLAEASAEKSGQDLTRAQQLFSEGLQSQEQLDAARAGARVDAARVEAAASRLLQQQANLEKARYDLDKVTVTAPMSGIITRLNVEEGENAIMGTLNNPGTVLLVIADLRTMEARVNVDETEVVKMSLDQSAQIRIDAFPDSTFTGRVSEIGNSPIFTSSGASQQAVDFEVKITLAEQIPNIRPGLSCKAEITVAARQQALAVPMSAVLVRQWPPEEPMVRQGRGRRSRRQTGPAPADTAAATQDVERQEKEGVFVVEDGQARFKPVTIGIAGEEDFELLSGLQAGAVVVTGPYRILRDLSEGDAVKRSRQQKGSDEEE